MLTYTSCIYWKKKKKKKKKKHEEQLSPLDPGRSQQIVLEIWWSPAGLHYCWPTMGPWQCHRRRQSDGIQLSAELLPRIINISMADCGNSSASAKELLQSCTEPSLSFYIFRGLLFTSHMIISVQPNSMYFNILYRCILTIVISKLIEASCHICIIELGHHWFK